MSKSSVVERLRKRRCFPLVIDGETVHIRSLTESEKRIVMDFKDCEQSFGYAIGMGLVNDDRTQVFMMSPDETAIQFGERVLVEADLPTDTRTQLATSILKLTNGPTAEQLKAIEKNC